MFITPLPALFRLLLFALLLGAALGALYDVLRIFKVALLGKGGSDEQKESSAALKIPPKSVKKRRRQGAQKPAFRPVSKWTRFRRFVFPFLLHFVTDLLFFFFAAVVTVIFLYAFHRGKLRLSAVFAMGVGFFLYYETVGKVVYSLAERIVETVRRGVRFVLAHTWHPLKGFVLRLGRTVRALAAYARLKKGSRRELRRFLLSAEKGFGAFETEKGPLPPSG